MQRDVRFQISGAAMRQYGMSIGDQQRPEACLVISYNDADQGRQFTCLSLYAATDGAYNQIYGIIDQLTGTYGLKNQEPSDHEVIHSVMSQLARVSDEQTRVSTRHFHWVCALGSDAFCGLLIKLRGVISKPVLQTALQTLGKEQT
jgi:hypothetical protein